MKSSEFLLKMHPNGPWNLVAIAVDKKGIDGATFYPGDDVDAWLKKYQDRNIYWTVNPILKDIKKKPTRGDIKEMAFLHVDLDPRAGEKLEEERERILKLLRAATPKPTAIVFSGGGYQAFWRLREPFPINGQEEAFEEAKLYNLQLEILYGADHCHNVDRIMRLPGTTNWPDEKKRNKGREKTEATVVEINDLAYDLSEFTKAAQIQSATTGVRGKAQVEVSGNVQRLDKLDDLPVSNLCKVVIAQGMDPDDPSRWGSRSEPLWWVVCELVREDVDDDTIYAIITDPDWSISGHVLDQSRPHDYAIRQIERAKEEAVDPWLRELNDEYAVVQIGGRCKILREELEPVGEDELRPTINYMSFPDFHNFFSNQFITIQVPGKDDPVSIPVGKWWTNHKKRRTYEGVTFVPGALIGGYYNLWKGFAFEAKPGDCSLFLDHVRDNICQGNEEWFNYLMGWMATAIQKPDEPGHTAIVFRGRQGTGKGFFANTFGKLFGRHFLPVRDSNHIFGQFNHHLRDCVVLFADEAFWAGHKKHEGMLKSLVTEPTIMSESKGVNAIPVRNYIHLIMASNEDWVVPADHDDRRFFVLDVGTRQMQKSDYFSKIAQQMEDGGYEALLHLLMTHDLSEFDVRRVPKTQALHDQKMLSMAPEEDWWLSKLRDGRIYESDGEWAERVWVTELVNDYLSYANQWRHTSSQRALSSLLGRVLPGGRQKKQASGRHQLRDSKGESMLVDRPYFYIIPTLAECRAHWDKTFGPYPWPEVSLVEVTDHHDEDF